MWALRECGEATETGWTAVYRLNRNGTAYLVPCLASCNRYIDYPLDFVRLASRPIPPQWRSLRLRPPTCTYAPWGCIVRADGLAKSRKTPTRKMPPLISVARPPTPRCAFASGTMNKVWRGFLGFVSLFTRTPHGAASCVQTSKRNRIDRHSLIIGRARPRRKFTRWHRAHGQRVVLYVQRFGNTNRAWGISLISPTRQRVRPTWVHRTCRCASGLVLNATYGLLSALAGVFTTLYLSITLAGTSPRASCRATRPSCSRCGHWGTRSCPHRRPRPRGTGASKRAVGLKQSVDIAVVIP